MSQLNKLIIFQSLEGCLGAWRSLSASVMEGREAEAEARKAHLFSKGKGREPDLAKGQSVSLERGKEPFG